MELIRKRHRSMQMIIITGYGSIEAVERALRPDASGDRPAVDFIEKNRIHQELLPRVEALLADIS